MNQMVKRMESLQAEGYGNVPEAQTLHDTVLISLQSQFLKWHDGWFNTFAAAGTANNFPFFNVRNKNHGTPYCNQETRDQLPYAMEIYSLGVSFWGPATHTLYEDRPASSMVMYHEATAIWQYDIPRHASIRFNINQDERLNAQCCMVPSGMGPVGGGVGRGVNMDMTLNAEPAGHMFGVGSMGEAEITSRWKFPNPLQVPRRASISAVVSLSEYGRQLLQHMSGPMSYWFHDRLTPDNPKLKYAAFGITVSLTGKRLIQQRGKYHA